MEHSLISNIVVIPLLLMFLAGFGSCLAGVAILVHEAFNKETNAVLAQTTRLAQKGLVEETTGLVGTASALLNTINDMMRTRNGTGFTLILAGGVIMIVSCWFMLQALA